ncbi:hypothetical protein [Laspinema palackyanum]|uniref:hypothetical protein n=1 Tax=Laspinema palackyanum TaxID=3231601 RepID=UPI00345C9BA0|nr:hypothetical protein [Laspinema sp. D2c]
MSFLLYAPNVHLFSFHLTEIEDTDSAPDYQPHYLRDRCLQIFDRFQIQQGLKLREVTPHLRMDLLQDTSDDNILLSLKGKLGDKPITGVVGYLQLYDSYALYLNLRIPELDEPQENRTQPVDGAIFKQFNQNQQWILDSSIGQVIILTGWLSPAQQKKGPIIWQKIADYCLQSFLETSDSPLPPCYQASQLFGSPVFEYGDPRNPDQYQMIWVWLFLEESEGVKNPSALAESNLCLLDQELLDLFFYRQKIVKTFADSREIYRDTRAEYKKIGTKVKAIRSLIPSKESSSENLSQSTLMILQKSQVELLELDVSFSENLRGLETSRLTLEANANNYHKKLVLIQSFCPQEKLDILENFYTKNCVNFQEQIKLDLGYFTHIRSLADKAVASIRGIVEIEQTQRDRQRQDQEKQLENTIQAIGLAVGTGAIFASSAGLITQPWRSPWAGDRSSYPHPFLIAVFGSFLLAAIVYWGVKRYQNRGKKVKKN